MNRPVFHYFTAKRRDDGEAVTFQATNGAEARKIIADRDLVMAAEIHERAFFDKPDNRRHFIHAERIDTSPEAVSCRVFH